MGQNKNYKEKKLVRIKTKLRIDDEVIKICGKDKGKHGKIIALNLKTGRIIVKGINYRKKFQRPTQENPKGGVLEEEQPMHISNVMFYDPKLKKGVRLAYKINENKKKVRISKATGKEV